MLTCNDADRCTPYVVSHPRTDRGPNGARLQLDLLNLFNAKSNQIRYYYLSRVPGEQIEGVFVIPLSRSLFGLH